MAANKKSKNEKKITKQFIIEHLDEKEIDLSMCELSQVPVKELSMVTRGSQLDLSRNLFTTLPDNFGILKHLVELDLSSNQLIMLPDSISQLSLLQKLDLYSNKLSTLPLTFWQLKKLKWLDLRNNNLETRLAEAAGPCVNEKECKQCASRILVVMKQKSAEQERKRQTELQQKREEERKAAEKEQMKQEEARRAKAELRQRKREEHNRMKQEKAMQNSQDEQEVEPESVENELVVNRKSTNTQHRSCVSLLCWTLVSVVLLVLLLGVGSYYYCDHLKGTHQVCLYWREIVNIAEAKWTEQTLPSR